jgi:hypothetical protein
MELTKEYFDSVVGNLATKDELKDLATKADLAAAIAPLATKQDVADAVDELARITAKGFLGEREYLESKLDVTHRVTRLESDVREIKTALHIEQSA